MPNAGYEYLLCYKLTVPIYDYTVEFCKRWISPKSRTTDQMVQAARSGTQNTCPQRLATLGLRGGRVAEGYQDYLSFARQQKLPLWGKEKVGEIREIGEIWETIKKSPVLPDHPNFPYLPDSQVKAVNLMITLVHQANFLLDKLILSLKERHRVHGGLTEELYQARKSFRGY